MRGEASYRTVFRRRAAHRLTRRRSSLDGNTIPQELIGNAVLTVAFVLIAWALLREAARWTIKILVVFGVVMGIAVLTGFLDNTAASGLLYWVGAWFSQGIVAVASWMADTWQQLVGVGETAA